jgi:hypothetical protein
MTAATSMRTLQAVYGKHMMPNLRAAADTVAHSSDTRNLRANPTTRTATKKRRHAEKKVRNKGFRRGGRDRD